MEYSERLYVPLRWWVQGIMLIATFWLALLVAVPENEGVVWIITGFVVALMAVLYAAYGAVVRISDDVLTVGRARIETHHLGEVEALDAERTRAVAGREADARAHLVLRPYLKRSVKIAVTDPSDPAPYWLVSTRHPEKLAAALRAAGASAEVR
ncbi:DUF3093 domain-containing protein [Nocardioides yefusunii]|uniref:DUF3093 domain-containing protein n=1 Tax=Nocardioides yefusunii TaxID=2500546 RepID=A0ABW1QW80_9ACTN|nr:DUF3093 domain-containing protein [Nocardioides yefusunii]